MAKWIGAALALALAACGAGGGAEDARGRVGVTVEALTGAVEITRVTISSASEPGDVELARHQSGAFTGTLVLSPGVHVLTARAWSGAKLVGEGAGEVTVVSKQTAAVVLKVKDKTGPAPVPDHGPFLTSVSASSTYVLTGEAIALAATAVDPDGDSVTWQWKQSAGCAGAFTAPTSATTDWSSPSTGACVLTVTATAKGLSDAQTVEVFVAPQPAGAVSVSAIYVPNPRIDSVYVRATAPTQSVSATVSRSGPNASYPIALYAGETVELELWASNVPWGVDLGPTLTDSCGGSPAPVLGGSSSPRFQWKAPAAGGVCMLTAGVTYEGLSDAFPVAVEVSRCKDDAWEHADTADRAAYLYLSGTGESAAASIPGLWAHDDDWFALSNAGANVKVTLTTTDRIPVELYDAAGVLVAAGVNGVEATGLPRSYATRLRVRPGARAAACDSGYDLAIESL